MRGSDMVQEFLDFKKKLKIQTMIKSKDQISPSHQRNQQTLKQRIGLISNSRDLKQSFKCITHQDTIRYHSQEDIVQKALHTPKKKVNITDRLLSYTQLLNFQDILTELNEADLRELPVEYKQQLEKLSTIIKYKLCKLDQ